MRRVLTPEEGVVGPRVIKMLGVFSSVKAVIPMRNKVGEPFAEGFCNKLHYRLTFALLLGCSALVTCLEWVGNGRSISCILEGAEDTWAIPVGVINTYCYIMTTFSLPKHWNSKVGEESASFGVGHYVPGRDEVVHKAYYQWVPFVLFLQAMAFYMPHWFFKIWEGGKVRNIISGLNRMILDKKDRVVKERCLARYVVDSLHSHNLWALRMLFVDFLNLINVIGNIYFVDIFLGGEFSTFGLQVVRFMEDDPETRIDPMARVFPRVTKCTYRKYGPSGTIQNFDSMCILPINIINEKIYVFLWFWFILLSLITFVGAAYHVLAMMKPSFTMSYLSSKTMHQPDVHLEDVSASLEVGDWKLLYILGRNMEPITLAEFLRELVSLIKVVEDKEKTKIIEV